MKTLKFIILFFSLAIIHGCENYTDNPIEYTPVYPLSGEWRIRITDLDANNLVTNTMYTFGTYNTADYSSTEMWIRTTGNMAGGLGTLRGKVTCNVSDLSFSATNERDISHASATFSITDAKITANAISMPSGTKADKISFKLTTSKVPGKTFLLEGYRRTLWVEDETYIAF